MTKAARAIAGNDAALRGTVERLYFASPAFTAGTLQTAEGDKVPFAGALMVQEGDRVMLHGRFERHPKYGRQFQVERFEFDRMLDKAGLAEYLAKHPRIKGIGPVKARAIAERFGDDFERHLSERPQEIAAVAHVDLHVIEALRDEWGRTATLNQALVELSAYGLTHHQVNLLTQKYGNATLAVLADNPYVLVREVKGLGFRKVDQVALKLGVPKTHPKRLEAGLQCVVGDMLNEGHTWTDSIDLCRAAAKLLTFDRMTDTELLEPALDRLISDGVLSSIHHAGRFLIARPDAQSAESELSLAFASHSNRPHWAFAQKTDSEIDGMIVRHAPGLNAGQRAAMRNALRHRISVISGGAGSGKTFTIAALCRIFDACDLKVTLAAPTGKAAKRIEELTGREASTIHRLLGYDGRSFQRGPDNPISTDGLILDEVSMVDVKLAAAVFASLNLKQTIVILVGDHNQLPAVGPGDLLRDLIERRLAPTVVLDEVVRQAGVLKENCTAILHGEVCKSVAPTSDKPSPWYVHDGCAMADDVRRVVLSLFGKVLGARLGFDPLQDVQLLTPTRKGPLGVDALNAELQRLFQKQRYGVDVFPPTPGRRPRPLVGDKVIQRRNNYDLGIMNGAVGIVVAVDPKTRDLEVRFGDLVARLESAKGHLADIDLAYALTIHQCQGSEFPCAVVIVHKSHSFMHNRNLIYTGVTRAGKTAIVVGDRWGIRNAVQRRADDRRRTLLALPLEQPA